MLDLSLFKVRNFAVTNIETLVVYAGLFGAFFFITLFLQQTAGYSPIEAGLATTPGLAGDVRALAALREDRRPGSGRGCRCASGRSSAASGCCC